MTTRLNKPMACELTFGYLIKAFMVVVMLGASYSNTNAQDDQASLILDLRKARAAYEIARQNLETDEKLLEEEAISNNEFNNSKNELLSREVDYQKLILRLIAQQSYIIVENATKYQTKNGDRRVKIVLRSTMEGNQEYLDQFSEHFDVFSPEMRSDKTYNIFVSLENIEDKTIISSPYELRIPTIKLGGTGIADFGLLRDVESLKVNLNYSGRKDEKNIYLEKDASANVVDIISTQFSQESDLGSKATYDLSLERFSTSDDVYRLLVLNLPQQISYDFTDSDTRARLSQIKFTQGVNIKNLSLRVYLPDRNDEQVVIDKPLTFYAMVVTNEQFKNMDLDASKSYAEEEINEITGGKVKLELIPRGVGRIEVRVPNLYHEIVAGEQVAMDITVRNGGTRRLDNIKISTDNPLHWKAVIEPDLIRSLAPEEEQIVKLNIHPPDDVGVGAQEVKIRTQAMADNRRVGTEDKTLRIQVEAKTPVLWTIFLVLLLIGLVVGIVVFGIKISKR
jgi:hypothetical protein